MQSKFRKFTGLMTSILCRDTCMFKIHLSDLISDTSIANGCAVIRDVCFK